LPGIRRIGSDLLISGKGSIENYFTPALTGVPIAKAAEYAPVFER
jgi:hypothetical protein